MSNNYATIKQKAENIISTYTLTTPVQIFELAKFLNINWKNCSTNDIQQAAIPHEGDDIQKCIPNATWTDVLGYFDKHNNILYINQENQSITRQRFTMAHEIGHHQLHNHLEQNHFRTAVLKQDMFSPRYPEETEANYFAAYILMPDHAIIRAMKFSDLMPTGEFIIQEFAKLMAVSKDAMRIRLRTYKEEHPDMWTKYNMDAKLI